MQAAPSPQQTSVRVENVTSLKGLIQEIESQTSYRISYQGNLADNVPVKIAKSTKSVSQLLDEALRGTGITYIIRQNNIILTRAEAQSPASAAPAPAAPRKQHIAGQVLDAATRQPIIGATIWIKDSALGTSTASDGSFDYSFSGNFGFVTVSYVGYQTQEFPIDRIPKVISLSPDNNLEEVVVVGYGAQKKASIIGSIASVPVNDIKMPTGKISNNLAGQLAGVISVQRSGEPGASSTFWIRGISTFGSNKSPLVLVDGIERDLKRVYEIFPRLEERKNQIAGTLSGGEQQMLAMGRGIMSAPDLIMLDEPSLGLAPLLVNTIFDTIREIKAMGKTILLVEQNALKALSVADNAYVLEQGRITKSGPGKELLKDPAIAEAYLGKAAR